MKKLFLILPFLSVFLLFSGLTEAHEGHRKRAENHIIKQEEKARQSAQVSGSEAQPASSPTALLKQTKPRGTEIRPTTWKAALWGHWHHKLIHFPIALGIFASLLIFIKHENAQSTSQWALALAFFTGILAFISGQFMFQDFSPDSPYLPLLERHRFLGIGSILLLGIVWLLSLKQTFQKWMWLYALFLILSLSLTGFYGGWIAHG